MKLELDERIESLSDIFNFSDVENAKQFIGQKGYFYKHHIFFRKFTVMSIWYFDESFY